MTAKFVHLRVHSEYAIVDSLIRLKPLAKRVSQLGMDAIGLTDPHNLFGCVKFYRACLDNGVKPIIGADFYIANPEDKHNPFLITLLAQNQTGYLHLCELISKAYINGQENNFILINHEWLEEYSSGLICLSGGRLGEIGFSLLKDNQEKLTHLTNFYKKTFDNRFYLEIQRTQRINENNYNNLIVSFAEENNLPLVATNDVRFLDGHEFEAHEARVCINQGRVLIDQARPKNYSAEQYLKSPDEMESLFSDIPEALQNTVEIAKRCTVELKLGHSVLPQFPIPEGMTTDSYFRQSAHEGLQEKFNSNLKNINKEKYVKRLDRELDVIIQMGFPGYFLIVADFIQWALNNGVPVGPGRGSGAGSLVAYVLKITDLDPLEHDLLFERFLNPERVSMPDFDIDFCIDGRDRVIDYVAQKYGRESVSQIITFGTMAAKAVIRDVGRVLSQPYGFVDKLAKLVPFEIGMTLTKALEQEPQLKDLYDTDDEVKTLIDLALQLEGLTRNAGKHAGGVVISPSKLTDFAPLYCEAGGENLVTQYDKDDAEAVGLVKFDFLGLRNLTIINNTVITINKNKNKNKLKINTLPIDDKPTYDLIKNCQTTAIFQLESRGMKDLIKRLQPDCFDEITALVALFRPGPLQSGMVDDFIDRKHGRSKVEYSHPLLEPILASTYGVILYQEQVMQIAQSLAGYTLGGADMLRRAMGKKKPEEMAKQRDIFTKGAVKNNIEESTATYIFDLMEKFAGYGFNKSHSAAYALVAYQTAYLKAHYPAEFMAAVLSADMDNTDKVVILVEEARDLKLPITPPNINSSQYRFTNQSNTIIYGLGAIKGAGEAAINSIIKEREDNGEFKSLWQFSQRLVGKKVNKKVLEALIKSGAMDELGPSRAAMFASIEPALKLADQNSKASIAGQGDLFSNSIEVEEQTHTYPELAPWTDKERLDAEKSTLGFYLSGHPCESYRKEFSKFTTCRLNELGAFNNKKVTVAGMVLAIRTLFTKRGHKMAVITMEDAVGRTEVAIFPSLYETHHELLIKDQMIVIEGQVGIDDYNGQYRIAGDNCWDLSLARARYGKYILLNINHILNNKSWQIDLKNQLYPYKPGQLPICLDYIKDNARAKIQLGQEWKINPSELCIDNLKKWLGQDKVEIAYK